MTTESPPMNPDSPVGRMGPDIPRCGVQTLAGHPCPRARQPGADRCYTHLPKEARDTYLAGKAALSPAAVTAGEVEAIVAELSAAEDAAAVRGALARVTGLVLAGAITPRVGATVAQLAGQTLKALAQDHSSGMRELHKLLDAHASEQVRGWSRRRKGGHQ